MVHFDKHNDAKVIVSFLVLVLAFAMLVLFLERRDEIMAAGNFNYFMTAVVVGMGFLFGLMYLVHNSDTAGVNHEKVSKAVKASKSTKKKKK